MRADKKKARSKNKLAELFGMEAPERPTGPSASRIREDNSREAEAVLDYIAKPDSYREKTCRRCRKMFLVNRGNVALCSDHCREKELADVGITWRWDRSPSERWYYVYDGDKRNTEPLVIGPEAAAILPDLASTVVSEPLDDLSNLDDLDDIGDLLGSDTENIA